MGNRAVITTSTHSNPRVCDELGLYLHWNGGRDSVEAFLTYCKLHGYRAPETDCYGWVSLATVIGNFFSDGLSCGIDRCCKLDCDNGDNGVYVIKNWGIIDRKYFEFREEQKAYDLKEMLLEIDKSMPETMRLGEKVILDHCEEVTA